MREFCAILAICVLPTWLACSDDGSPGQLDHGAAGDSAPVTDSAVTQDTMTVADGSGPVADAGSPQADGGSGKVDFGNKPLNCQEASLCAEACAKACSGNFGCMMTCNSTCKAKACPSAQPLFDSVTQCTQTQCLLQCMSGPSTQCADCITTKCSNQVAACNAHTC